LKARRQPHGKLFPLSASPREVSRKFTKLARKAGLKISLHDVRRSFGSRYASVVPAPVLQRLMRHADIKTTLGYYICVDDQLEKPLLTGCRVTAQPLYPPLSEMTLGCASL